MLSLETVLKIFMFLMSLGGLCISIGIYIMKIRNHERQIKELSEQIKVRLYRKDGAPIYMSVERCKESRDSDNMLRDTETIRIWDEIKLLRKAIEDLPDKMEKKFEGALKMIVDAARQNRSLK